MKIVNLTNEEINLLQYCLCRLQTELGKEIDDLEEDREENGAMIRRKTARINDCDRIYLKLQKALKGE